VGPRVRIRLPPAKSRANSGTSLNGPISGFPWCDLLQTEADADADGTAEDGKRGEVDADGIEADQQRRIRERVPRELGIAADLSVDPMTAVAIGAAIYAESREWAASSTKRKATRTSTEVAPDLGLKFDYQARTTQDSARLRVRAESNAVAARLCVQVDAPEHGWTSGGMRTRDLKADRGLLTLCRFTLLQDALARAAATFVRPLPQRRFRNGVPDR
jgi:hypothetical protein